MIIETESRTALGELIKLLTEIDERWSSPEWNLASPEDVAGSHRALMHILEAGLVGTFEQDARKPTFRRIVTPSRKLTGDNSDAIYFDAPLSPEYEYAIHGNTQGAAYFSMTIECGSEDGTIPKKTGGVINDTSDRHRRQRRFHRLPGRRAARQELAAAQRRRLSRDHSPLFRTRTLCRPGSQPRATHAHRMLERNRATRSAP